MEIHAGACRPIRSEFVSEIANNLIIIIMDADCQIPDVTEKKLRKNNHLSSLGFFGYGSHSTRPFTYEFELHERFTSLQIQQLIQVVRKSASKHKSIVSVNGDLTLREKEVIRLIAIGYANKEIADRLNISIHTVISHRKNITEKLNIKSIRDGLFTRS
jgi:DNA-binding CsgD family transcriptional regulator